jgi:hypothetical protein
MGFTYVTTVPWRLFASRPCFGEIDGAYGGFHPTVAVVPAAMRRAGIPLQELSNFCAEAAEAQEDNLLRTCRRWVDVKVR